MFCIKVAQTRRNMKYIDVGQSPMQRCRVLGQFGLINAEHRGNKRLARYSPRRDVPIEFTGMKYFGKTVDLAYVPPGNIAIEFAAVKHMAHAFNIAYTPSGNISVERRIGEHAVHRGCIRYIPLGDIAVEIGTVEQLGKVMDTRYIKPIQVARRSCAVYLFFDHELQPFFGSGLYRALCF